MLNRTVFPLFLGRAARALLLVGGLSAVSARATLVNDPNDPRTWQGAGVGTFAALYHGSDTPANRQQVIDDQLLDDGIFDPTNFVPATLMPTAWTGAGGGGCLGTSTDLIGAGDYNYACGGANVFTHANTIDNLWFQSGNNVGDTIFDLGFHAPNAAIFPSIDHGPLPQEAIESTVYLSNDLINWTPAVVRRVFLEGFQPILGIQWDGFTYVVSTGTNNTFRYASIIHGGSGALWNDGDDEINGVMGLYTLPEPASVALVLLAAAAMRRRR